MNSFFIMLTAAVLLSIYFIAHTVADVFMQPRTLAMNKHHSWIALTKHVVLYTCTAALISLPAVAITGWTWHISFWLVQGLTHQVVDAITSRGNAKAWAVAQTYPPESELRGLYTFHAIAWICVDQIMHSWIIITSFMLGLGILLSQLA